MTVYAFGLEEHVYSGSGTNQGNTYYYSLAGRLIGAKDANGTVFYMTDTLGSILASFTNAAGGATLKGNQVFGPYGNARYFQGNINTAKGFTGQYNDSLTGLDYYGARYYDPVAGVFLSADPADGNNSGNNPYAYVNGNPETFSDPTGLLPAGGPVVAPPPSVSLPPFDVPPVVPGVLACTVGIAACFAGVAAGFTIWLSIQLMNATGRQPRPQGPNTPQPQPVPTPTNTSPGGFVVSVAPQPQPGGFAVSVAPQPLPTTQTGSGGRGNIPPIIVAAAPAPCSFASDTPVTTDHGKQAIGKLQVGDKVLAYNPKTHKMELKPILHVWTHTDKDLIDVTISYSTLAQHGKGVNQKSEVLHTTSEHPFMTTEQGFVPAGNLKTGMHVLQADGSVGVITGWKIASGTQVMYNLEVAQDHTFTVGDGQWVVHNECDPGKLGRSLNKVGRTVQQGQNPHHIIPCALENHALVQQATNAGFDINAEYNGRPLWDYNNKPNALADAEPYHANSPSYLRLSRGLLDAEYQRLYSSGMLTPNNAYDSVMYTINLLNTAIDWQGYIGLLAGAACPLPGI